MGPGASDKEHGQFTLTARPDLQTDLLHLGHLFGDHRFHPFHQGLVPEIGGHLTQRLGRGLGPDKIDLEPGDAVALLHHLSHVVDGTMTHDHV
jgi:hypothetical protein